MELTVGTTLQGNKYVVQEVLNQTEQEITCKATHIYLEQAVILQTFNPALQQQETFAPLKQQFMAGVRSIAKQARPPLQVLDYFEENGLPFVVVPLSSSPPTLDNWLKAPTPPTDLAVMPNTGSERSVELTATLPSSSTSSSTSMTVAPIVESGAVTNARAVVHQPVATETAQFNDGDTALNSSTRSHTYEPIIFHPTPRSNTATQVIATKTEDNTGRPRSLSSQPKSKFPILLMVIAVTSGLVGVGTGFALRFAPAMQNPGKTPRLGFLQRQQSFPAEGSWPIQRRPVYTVPEPTLEQPLYRAAPPTDYRDPTFMPSPSFDSVPDSEPAVEEPPSLPAPQSADNLNASPPLKTESKPSLELAPLPEVNPDPYTLPPEVESPPLITDPPTPILPEPNSDNPAPKPLFGNSSRIVTQ
ncbi:serine/threonine-protein kinase [Thermocoleostomius sinensis]|uniref:Uncharacterized protein n=1 Tax=Thermocoleostomius sinensis A174 TaxID=2016057 RepID=A0A9E8ZPI1_9CYAN|nr:hypothetical protein [Thermocoleostomius sinensis]WAL62516.1 hypothetical protein OXH18_11135 [Thermocoleostomius sinensis A174]